jgi:hypothetical protein
MAKLTFVLEDGQEVVVPLKEHITIGRDEDNDIVVDDERISSHHAEIVQNADGSLQVFDLRSTAGTFVNGESQLSCTLLHGDTIAFGPLVGTLDLEDAASALDEEPQPPVSAEVEAPLPTAAASVSKAPAAPPPPDNSHLEALARQEEALAKLEAEKSRLKAEIATAENDLRDWQQRAEKERALHSARLESEAAVLPASPSPPDTAHLETVARQEEALAKLEAEKSRLKVEVENAEKELRDWQQRAEKERALHFARVESLRAEEEKLEPTKAAVQQAESAHREWLETISSLASQHDDKTAALERLNAQHYEKSTELQRLTTAANETRQEIENLATQKEEAAAHLKQIRDECEQDESLLNSLRQQIIEHEKRIVEEEARHASLNASSAALSAKHQRDEAAVKDLESLLMTLEQKAAAAEGSLQRLQADLAVRDKDLAARTAELAACEKNIAARSADLAAENKRIVEARAQRAELEQHSQELLATKQQLVDARQRLAAVELRYRDAQSNGAQGGSQIAPPRRQGPQEDAPKAATTPQPAPNAQHVEVTGQIETARRELADLEARIASLREVQAAAGGEISQNPAGFPPPLVVQVETIKLAPIPIKSERTRGPGTKKAAAALGAGKPL